MQHITALKDVQHLPPQVPIMVKSKLCHLHGLTPEELISKHEEAEVFIRLNAPTLAHLLYVLCVGDGGLLYSEWK